MLYLRCYFRVVLQTLQQGLVVFFYGEPVAGGFGAWVFWLAAAWPAELFVLPSLAIDFLIWTDSDKK